MKATYGAETALWKMADQLRAEGLPGIRLVEWLSALILLRWADFVDAEAEAVAAFEDEDYTPIIPNAYHWRKWQVLPSFKLQRFLQHELPRAVTLIRDRHHPVAPMIERAAAVFAREKSFPAGALGDLVEWLAQQRFETPSDRLQLRSRFDALLDKCEGRDIGEFRTPTDINKLVIGLLKPKAGESIYDPCCGTAGFLTAACDYLRSQAHHGFTRNGDAGLVVSGRDIDGFACLIASARLILSGVTDARLDSGNSLEQEPVPEPLTRGYDLIACNPPWGVRVPHAGRQHFAIPTDDATGLFVQHVLGQLKPEGRAAIIVPQSFLFQKSSIGKVRSWILKQHRLELVVSLPEGALMPYTGIKAAVILFRRDGGGTQQMRVVDASSFFDKGRRGSSVFEGDSLERLLAEAEASGSGENSWTLDAEELRKFDYDLSPVPYKQSTLLQKLEKLGDQVEVVPLAELCDIQSGVAVASAYLHEKVDSADAVPYLRIGDVQNGQVTRGKLWVADTEAAKVSGKKRLRAGHVVVSRSGTIGKVGVVRNGAVGGVASSGFFVLTPDQSRIDPHYLALWLSSESCSKWLGARTRGVVIQTLRREILNETPVPLVHLALQQRLVEESETVGLELLDQLTLVLNESDDNPALQWLMKSLSELSETSRDDPEKYPAIIDGRVFGRAFKKARKWWNESQSQAGYEAWMGPFGTVADLIVNLRDVPSGPVLASVLEGVAGVLVRALPELDANDAITNRARRLASECLDMLRASVDAMLGDIKILLEVTTVQLQAGCTNELRIRVSNSGRSPVTGVTLRSELMDKMVSVGFVGLDAVQEIAIEVDVPQQLERNDFRFEWSGRDLRGKTHQGSQSFHFDVREVGCLSSTAVDLGSSPYSVGPPVGPNQSNIFYGRERVLEQIKNQIRSGNTVLLEGNRRSGKSSILKHLEGLTAMPGWIAVFADFQSAGGHKEKAGMPSESVWRSLAAALVKGLIPLKIPFSLPNGKVLSPGDSLLGYLKACREGIREDSPWEDFLEYFQTILMILDQKDLGLVLMIDEFDKLQEGIDNGVTSPQIPENIRYLIQHHPRFVAIMTGSRRMQRLRQEYWSALYGLGNRIGVSSLDEDAARKLVIEPVQGRLSYTEESVQLILRLTARQPFLIQSLCNRVFELAAEKRASSVTRSMVEESAKGFVRDNEHFASVWDYVESDRGRLITLLCHQLTSDPDPVTFGVIKDRLYRDGLTINDGQLETDLTSLRELEIIEFSGAKKGSVYSLTVPLMSQWLDQEHEYLPLLTKAIIEQENQP